MSAPEWSVKSARALLESITPGEWEAVDGHAFSDDWWVKTGAIDGPPLPDRNEANARFTAAAPSLVGWLLERLTEAEAARDGHKSLSEFYQRETATLRARVARLTEALRRLVNLKDGPHDSMYLREKPKAWERARAVLAEAES